MSETSPVTSDTPQPLFSVVSGHPTDDELAALTVVLTAAASAASTPTEKPLAENWGAPTRMHRTLDPFSPYSFSAL